MREHTKRELAECYRNNAEEWRGYPPTEYTVRMGDYWQEEAEKLEEELAREERAKKGGKA